MPRQAIKQATCEECDDDDAEFRVLDTSRPDDELRVDYEVECSCGHDSEISISDEGTHAGEGINHDDASWNQEDDDE